MRFYIHHQRLLSDNRHSAQPQSAVTFNLYLVFCLASDAVYFLANMLIWVAVLVNDVDYAVTGEDVLNFNALSYITIWIDNYWVSAILWMSFIVFIQIYKLLVANKQTKRYQPPARKRVIIDSMIVSAVFAAVYTMVNWEFWRSDWPDLAYNFLFWIQYIPTLVIPTLLIAGMCFKVWRNKLLPTKNARYRSLTMFFARLLASAFVMIPAAILPALLMWYLAISGDENYEAYQRGIQVLSCIFYLLGVFQLCMALTKKDVRLAFVDMWCCRNTGGKTSTTTLSGTVRSTAHESNHHNDDNYGDDDGGGGGGGESPALNDALSPEADSSIHISEIDAAPSQSADNTTSRSIVFKDIDEEQAGENFCSAIDEMKAENKF
jgi:hypothetical protein